MTGPDNRYHEKMENYYAPFHSNNLAMPYNNGAMSPHRIGGIGRGYNGPPFMGYNNGMQFGEMMRRNHNLNHNLNHNHNHNLNHNQHINHNHSNNYNESHSHHPIQRMSSPHQRQHQTQTQNPQHQTQHQLPSHHQSTDADAVHAAMALISLPSRVSNEISPNYVAPPMTKSTNKYEYDHLDKEGRSQNINVVAPDSTRSTIDMQNQCDMDDSKLRSILNHASATHNDLPPMSYQNKSHHNYIEESSVVTRSSTSSLADNIRDDISQDSTATGTIVPVIKRDVSSQVKLLGSTCGIFAGSVSLAMPEDKEVLSPLHCFMRLYCIEAFTVNEYDTNDVKGANRLRPGMVGIRCVHCKSRPTQERAERAVCYPSSVKNIYYSMETWQRRHATVCKDIPAWVKKEMTNLIQASKSCAGGRRQYWADAAIKIGMIDTPDGIRFARHPESLPFQVNAEEKSIAVSSGPPSPKKISIGIPLVTAEDKYLITSHLYLLMTQMEPCRFTEEDRSGGRSKIKTNQIGYPGIQCKHCSGKAGFGRYFPTSAHSLTLANSDRNIYNHMMKCRRCPVDVKGELRTQRERRQGSDDKLNNRRGSRKTFFTRVWLQLHGKDPSMCHPVTKIEDGICHPSVTKIEDGISHPVTKIEDV